jgi:hypothetical protein
MTTVVAVFETTVVPAGIAADAVISEIDCPAITHDGMVPEAKLSVLFPIAVVALVTRY